MANFPGGGRRPKIVGKTTKLKKIVGEESTREVDFGDIIPFAYPQLCGW